MDHMSFVSEDVYTYYFIFIFIGCFFWIENQHRCSAFGGYFVLVLVVISTHSTWDPAPNYKLWTVVGSVVEQDGTPVRVLQSSDINLQPPITSTDDAGGFKIQIATGVGPANTPTYPTLTVKRDGYFPAPVELDPKNTQGQRWLSNVQRVNIPRITLQRMPKYISSGTPLVPVAAPEGIHP